MASNELKTQLKDQKSGAHSQACKEASAMPPTVYIKSYGCQMNVYDSTRMMDALASNGYRETTSADEADLVILNTCHIREKAAEKVYSELGRLRNLKHDRAKSGRPLQLAVAGCVAQAEGGEIRRRQPAVDLVIGPQNYHRLVDLLPSSQGAGIIETEFPLESKFDHLPQPSQARLAGRGYSAFVTVQEGCDKFCTFCVVPYTRGAEVSRPLSSVMAEITKLASAQVREITLIGQNVNAYHGASETGEDVSLARLIEIAAAVPGVERIRYTTSHPKDMQDDLIRLHGSQPKLMPYLHLPVQSGSDEILHRMNRKHTALHYAGIIGDVRRARPDIALSSDFIVGFPGETEEHFRDTMQLIADTVFASAYSFKYSARPGTPGAELVDDVPDTIKSRRLAELQALLEEQRQAFNRACVGRTLPVLLERRGRHRGQLVGKTPYLQTVQIMAAEALMGQIVPVRIQEAGSNSLFGALVV